MLVSIFPDNFAKPFIDANMLQIIVMAIFFGVAVILIGGEMKSRLEEGIRHIDALCMKTLEVVMKLSPLGVFCLMTPVVATNGATVIGSLAAVVAVACYGIPLGFEKIVAIALTSTLASVGTAGAPGAGIVMLAMVLSAAGLPLDGIALVAGVDRLFDMGRTVINITGDTTAALLVSVRRGRG